MQPREKKLLAAVLALVGLWALRYGYTAITDQFDSREKQIESLRQQISRKELQVRKGQKAGQRLAEYESRSLPANRELARSLYQNWLIGLIDKAGVACGVSSQSPQGQRGSFARLNFTVSGEGSLPQIVRLLHEFYASGQLHQIRVFTLRPQEKDHSRFDVMLAIEALSLPGALATDRLAAAAPPAGMGDLASYQTTIMGRNIFEPYTPPEAPKVVETRPAPQREPDPPPFDVARHTTVTAILNDNGQPQVWLNNRTTGEVLRLKVGSKFEIGDLRGTVEQIGLRDVQVLSDGRRWTLALGESLREAAAPTDDARSR